METRLNEHTFIRQLSVSLSATKSAATERLAKWELRYSTIVINPLSIHYQSVVVAFGIGL
jgi:hypothetical protein